MLVRFFHDLRAEGVPATLTEFLTLLEALERRVAEFDAESFYHLARAALVKDERHFDRFDRAFARHFAGAESIAAALAAQIPDAWLGAEVTRILTAAGKAKIEALGGWERLMQTLRERLATQQGRHAGGNRWIGTGGTSPFGNAGFNPEGVRVGGESRERRAAKVWERREYANLDDRVELGTRNLKLALRRLRRFARQGAAEELDLPDTIDATARNAGFLDVRLVPERRNAVKVLLLLDIGGSMDDHVRICEELFSAARGEFRHLEHFYFHNFVYESLWRDSRRRHVERVDTAWLVHKYPRDYRLIFVGDATMSPYEIIQAGGSLEHWNEEAGSVWMRRLCSAWPRHAWLNPEPEERWHYTPSVKLTRELVDDRMFALTLKGIDEAMQALN
ncbi:MAG TPA: VWA domain-containing protein [Steroidobacteraceae bacterium]|nr:VWA domain-containing protein [Steroidobacteraceae bacterium]